MPTELVTKALDALDNLAGASASGRGGVETPSRRLSSRYRLTGHERFPDS
jgi:hypothetical protein